MAICISFNGFTFYGLFCNLIYLWFLCLKDKTTLTKIRNMFYPVMHMLQIVSESTYKSAVLPFILMGLYFFVQCPVANSISHLGLLFSEFIIPFFGLFPCSYINIFFGLIPFTYLNVFFCLFLFSNLKYVLWPLWIL